MPAYDIVLYGATMAGCFAAKAAYDRSVALNRPISIAVIDALNWRGGMHTGGINLTDVGALPTHWGYWAQINQAVADYYAGAVNADISYAWRFEPYKMVQALDAMLSGVAATWIYNAPLKAVTKTGSRIASITCGGVEYTGKQFADCSYDGDLIKLAGVSSTYGRESTNIYGESFGGVAYADRVDRSYRMLDAKGNRYDGAQALSLHIPDGVGDAKIQGFNYRGCWSTRADRLPWQAPPGYRREDFLDVLHEVQSRNLTNIFGEDWWYRMEINGTGAGPSAADKARPQADGKWCINQRDQYGLAWEWPNATWARRKEIMARIYYQQAGTLFFLANDTSLAGSAIQTFAKQWGLAADEYQTGYYGQPGWAPILYVRESRRMLGQYVLTQADFANRTIDDSICVANYFVDKHTVQVGTHADGLCYKEGHKAATTYRGTSIPFRCIKPWPGQADNLLALVPFSCTSVIWQPLRMEPTFSMVGQVGGWTLADAIINNIDAINVPYSSIKPLLTAAGAIL